MRYTISLPQSADAKLQAKAQANHLSADAYLEKLVTDALDKPTLAEILRPVHEDFVQSGMTETEMNDFLSQQLEQSRRERRASKGA